jgi:sterol 3beta-glucosyltransferase
VVLEIERSPTLEFAETIEIKCVDLEDHMSVDSYFFASFQDNERAYNSIQSLLDARPSSDLPQIDSMATLPSEELTPVKSRTESTTSAASSAATSGFKKLGSVLKPMLSKSSNKDDQPHKSTSFSLPFVHKSHQPSNDSLDTLRAEPSSMDDGHNGYPPRPSGAPPPGHDDGKTWGPKWIRKPAAKIFGGNSSSTSESDTSLNRSSSETLGLSPQSTRSHPRVRDSNLPHVTEVVEPTVAHYDSDVDADGEEDAFPSARSPGSGSWTPSGRDQSTYSLMKQSAGGVKEEDETAKKFRSVFSLPEKETLLEREYPSVSYREAPG